MTRRTNVLLCLLFSIPAASCSADSKSSSAKPEQPSVTAAAYDALTTGNADQVNAMILDVDAAVEKAPDDGRAMLYSGLMRLWQLGDKLDLPTNAADVVNESHTMVDRFTKARALLPHDDRAPGFLGLAGVEVGKILGDTELVTQGMSDLDDGIAIFPAYTHFLRALASVDSPKDSDDFASVLDHLQTVADTCGLTKDSSGEFEYLKGPLPSALRVCNDEGIVPHVLEGYLVEYGDALLKAGKPAEEARAIYRSATHAPRFAEWPFASELQDRIDNADQRAALYADSDTTNDPTLWNQGGHLCIGCHQDHP